MARASLQAGDPQRIGHYRLTARLGAGGMGVVYPGVSPDRWDGSQVAVKVLRAELPPGASAGVIQPVAVSGLTGGGSHDITALAASGAMVTGIDSAQASLQFVLSRMPAG